MKNTTLSFDDFLLAKARKISDSLGISFNAWVNRLIKTEIEGSQKKQVEELFRIADEIGGSSKGKSWTRDELYER
jgi:hypothetical protein